MTKFKLKIKIKKEWKKEKKKKIRQNYVKSLQSENLKI